MKTLTNIRLINWHYFDNQTIPIKNNTLLTGQNASGKSTILDAISFVLTAGDQNFNLAANEKGKRDLRSYCKCKLGSLDQEYLRDYDLSSHICLEFFSEKQEKYFCLGAIIDVTGNVAPPKVLFYIIDSPLKDEFFYSEDEEIYNIQEFKKKRFTPYIFTTRKEAKSAFRQKMGGVSDKYFTLLPKALAFKPLTDVKDYIYKHLLDEKEVNVENIKDSIRSYKDLEAILKVTKNKIKDLETIKISYEELSKLEENKKFYDYVLKDLTLKSKQNEINAKTKDISVLEREREDLRKQIRDIDEKIANLDDQSKALYSTLSSSSEFKASELYDKQIESLDRDILTLTEEKRKFDRKKLQYRDTVLLFKENDSNLYNELSKLDLNFEDEESIKEAIIEIDSLKTIVDQKKAQLSREEGIILIKKDEAKAKVEDVFQKLKTLSSNEIPYRKEITILRQKMEDYLKDLYNESIRVHVLAEVIDVTDKTWHNTIEDFLANQRFALIVDPKYYEDCLDCYRKYKSNNIYGVTLVDTREALKFRNYQVGSIASIIETDNPDARNYINYLCGNVMMVDDPKDIRKKGYQSALTVDGMLYRGLGIRYLNPNTEKPFIGRNARSEQSSRYTRLGEQAKEEFQNLSKRQSTIKELLDLLESLNLEDLRVLVAKVMELDRDKVLIEELKEKKKRLSLSSLNDVRAEYENLKVEIRTEGQKRSTKEQLIGAKNQGIESLTEAVLLLNNEINALSAEIYNIETENISYKSDADKIYDEERKSGKKEKDIFINVEAIIKDHQQIHTNYLSRLSIAEANYASKYNRPFSTGFDAAKDYLDELDKLVTSELVKYEGKVREAREEAEKLFKEDFLSKLKSYILEAQDEIGKINETLNKIQFGRDKYEFIFPKSKEFGAIYNMIVDEGAGELGYTIFSMDFEEKYQKELDELFDHLSQDEENSMGALNKYTDYRTYMDYDIKVTSGQDVFYFSNINKEKSGGETQIPFYVAILASFVRLFDKAQKSGLDDSIGLILFDEVFDKMDNARTDAMMEFISNLDVQILLACPPQKMDSLSKHTETSIAVVREDKHASCISIRDK